MTGTRKEAIRKFKERKPPIGAYAVRCAATGRIWVGVSRNLDATRNGTWFALRSGGHIQRSLQEEWNRHGESSFQYEILEKLEEDLLPLAIPDRLKEQKARWLAHLHAEEMR